MHKKSTRRRCENTWPALISQVDGIWDNTYERKRLLSHSTTKIKMGATNCRSRKQTLRPQDPKSVCCVHKAQEVSTHNMKQTHVVAWSEHTLWHFWNFKSRLLQPEKSTFCSKVDFFFRVGWMMLDFLQKNSSFLLSSFPRRVGLRKVLLRIQVKHCWLRC